MKIIWKTAFAAYRLSLQTGSDDGYYPGPDYKFAHGSKRERKAINRALDIIKAPEDKMKGRAPGRILAKQRNRLPGMGPPTMQSFNCRCLAIAMDDTLWFGKAEDGPRTMHGLVAPDFATVDDSMVVDPKRSMLSDKQREAYESAMAEHRERHHRLLDQICDYVPSGRFVWATQGDKSTTRPIHKPGGADETPEVEE